MTATNSVLIFLYSSKSMYKNEFALIPVVEIGNVKSKTGVTESA